MAAGLGAPTSMASSDGDMGDMDIGGMGAAGMMSEEAMQSLAESRGAEFDQMWLQMMIAHHEGAITMAQQAEIESMQELLAP